VGAFKRSRFAAIVLIVIASIIAVGSAEASLSSSSSLFLDVYVDESGRALLTGYVDPEGLGGLSVLGSSQYSYDDQSGQLYAITDSLTWKSGEAWAINFSTMTPYDDFHVAFYLPGRVLLSRISPSPGLEYLVSASNDSMVIEFQGQAVKDPALAIEFRQPLESAQEDEAESSYSGLPLPLALAVAAGLILLLLGFWRIRSRSSGDGGGEPSVEREPHHEDGRPDERISDDGVSKERASDDGVSKERASDDGASKERASDDGEGGLEEAVTPSDAGPSRTSEEADATDGQVVFGAGPLEVSTQMAAVMETLTARERSVMETLISHGGRMTQANIRYETGIPKSSLTGILISLERRRMIRKKGWGRTNVIELCEWLAGGDEG